MLLGLGLLLFAHLPLTDLFLQNYPLEEIRCNLEEQTQSAHLQSCFDLFNVAIDQERLGFFGYHATTMRHWVYQEIVKQVLEKNGQVFPKNFYLLRAPSETFGKFQTASEFLEMFSEKKLSLEEKRRFINIFFLRPIGEELLVYTDEEAHLMYEAFSFSREDLAKRATAFLGKKTERLENWLDDPHQEDQRTTEEHEFIFKTLHPLDDSWEEEQQYLVALNFSLFGNYTVPTESTIYVFAKGRSIEADKELFEEESQKFLDTLGYAPNTAAEIFEEANQIFSLDQGLLLQFFDDAAYSHLDNCAYLSSNFGLPIQDQKPSEFLSRFDPLAETTCVESFTLHPQLRLLMTQETLSPSWLKIKQYDLVAEEQKEKVRGLITKKLGD